MSAGKKLAHMVGFAMDMHLSSGSRPPTIKTTDTIKIILIILTKMVLFQMLMGNCCSLISIHLELVIFPSKREELLNLPFLISNRFIFIAKLSFFDLNSFDHASLLFTFLFLLFYDLICSFAKPFSFLSCLFRARKICFDKLMRFMNAIIILASLAAS
jgi:hypothetical protein